MALPVHPLVVTWHHVLLELISLTGELRSVVVPSPKAPQRLLPQDQRVPSPRMAVVLTSVTICTQHVPLPLSLTGELVLVVLLLPNRPDVLLPQRKAQAPVQVLVKSLVHCVPSLYL